MDPIRISDVCTIAPHWGKFNVVMDGHIVFTSKKEDDCKFLVGLMLMGMPLEDAGRLAFRLSISGKMAGRES